MAYRSVYDEQNGDLGIGGQEYLVGENPTGAEFASMSRREIRQYTRDKKEAAQAEQDEIKAMAEEEFGTGTKVGGMGAKGAAGMSIMAIAGDVMNANDETFQDNYGSVGARSQSGVFKATASGKKSGGVVALGSHAVESFARRFEKQSIDRKRGNKMDVARDMTANILTAGLMSDPTQLKRKKREQAEIDARLRPNVAQVTGAAIGGYAMGGSQDEDQDIEMKKIEGRKGLDNVPIDGDFNNADDSGRTVKGFGQAGETIAKIEGRNYAFGVNTGFTKEADTIARRYKYNKDTDDFEGDELTQAAFASDIAKLKDDQEAFNKSIVMDQDGIPEVDEQGEYIIKDPNILSKIAKRRRTSPKVLANKLGETTIKQKQKEAIHAQQMGNIGGYALGGEEQPGDAIIGKYYASDFKDKDGKILKTPVNSAQALEAMRTMIFGVESQGNYNIVAGGKDDFITTGAHKGKALSELTVNELLAVQDAQPDNEKAAGAYQIMPETLRGLVENGDVSGDDTFNQATQDKLFKTLLDARGYEEYLAGDMTQAQFSKGLGQEWAGIPMLSDTTRRDKIYKNGKWTGKYRIVKVGRGQSYYKGFKDAGNKAGTTPEAVEKWFAEYGSVDENELHYGGEIPTINILGGKSGLPAARSSNMAVASDITPDILPSPEFEANPADINYADNNPYKGPFKKFRKKRWQKKHGGIDPLKEQENFASLGTELKGVAVGGYLDEEYDYNYEGYATGGGDEEEDVEEDVEIVEDTGNRGRTGQALRMLGMATPALYNIGYNLTQEPKKLSGNYMTSGIQNPEPVDITPELRDIEKAGASARAGGRARSSMAGQIVSQTAEQTAISKAYRAKTSIDQQADLQVEQMNAGIRQNNSKMKFNVDLQNIQAEEAHQQYMNTGMSQIGQIAQTMGTEALQKDQLEVMKSYYDTMGEQGQAMLDLRRDEMLSEATLQNRMIDLQFGVQTPTDTVITDPVDPKEVTTTTPVDPVDPVVTPEDEEAITLYGGSTQIWGQSLEEQQKIAEHDYFYLHPFDANANLADPNYKNPNTDEYGVPLNPYVDLSEQYTTLGEGKQTGLDVPKGRGFIRNEPVMSPDGSESYTANSYIGMKEDNGEMVPYLKSPEYEEGFREFAFETTTTNIWERAKAGTWLDYVTDPDIEEDFDPLSVYGNNEEAMQAMIMYLGKEEGLVVESYDDEGNLQYAKHKEQHRNDGGGVLSPGSWKDWKPQSTFSKVVGAAAIVPELLLPVGGKAGVLRKGVQTVGKLRNTMKGGKIFVNTALGIEQLAQSAMIVPKGMKAVRGPGGEIAFTKSSQFLRKGWTKIANAGQDVGMQVVKQTKRFKNMSPADIKATKAILKDLGVETTGKLPRGLYIPSAGGAILNASGKAIGYTAKKVVTLADKTKVLKALGIGKEGMIKAYRKAKFIYQNGGWWKLTKTVVKKGTERIAGGAVRGTREFGANIKTGYTGRAATQAASSTINWGKVSGPVRTALNKLTNTTPAKQIAELKKNAKLTKPQLKKAIDEVMKKWKALKTKGGAGSTTPSAGSSSSTVGSGYTYTTP